MLEPAYLTDFGRTAFKEFQVDRWGASAELVGRIAERMTEINKSVRDDKELGPSYFVPDKGDKPSEEWYKHVVRTQIAPLLHECWFDAPERV